MACFWSRMRSALRAGGGPARSDGGIGQEGEEVHEFRIENEPIEDLARRSEAPCGGRGAGLQARLLFVREAPVQDGVGRAAVVEPRAAMQPEPQLGARDLRGGGVLHEVID